MFVIAVTDPSQDRRYYCGSRYRDQLFAVDPHDSRVARYTGPSGDVEILCAAGWAAELVRLP